MDMEVFSLSSHARPLKRQKRITESRPAQKNLNDRRSRRYLTRMVHANFKKGDLAVDLTFNNDHLPKEREDVQREIRNYIKRIKRVRAKANLEPLKYVYVISNSSAEGKATRWHVHMIMNKMDRDVAEEKWGKGIANAGRLHFSETGITGRVIYMARQVKGERTWAGSNNLIKPAAVVSDHKVTRRQADHIVLNPDDRLFIEKLINGRRKEKWIFTDVIIDNDGTQTSIACLEFKDEWSGGLSFMIRARRLNERE